MKNHKANKLKLNHETVRVLATPDLAAIAGGGSGGGSASSYNGSDITLSRVTCCEK
jgi:hypothetical protein